MPYQSIGDLPDRVQNVLPSDAQHIFLAAFNSAEQYYRDDVTSFKVAWAAVEKQYRKVGGVWKRK